MEVKTVYIQRTLDVTPPIFILTLDSRYQDKFLSPNNVRNTKTTQIKVMTAPHNQNITKLKLTPPILLDQFNGLLPSRCIYILRDIVGDHVISQTAF